MPRLSLASTLLMVAAITAACSQVHSAPAPWQPAASTLTPSPAATSAQRSGKLTIEQWPNLRIDDKPLRAAPGARIFGSNNLMMTPSMVPSGARVHYELDSSGQVRVLRILDGAGR